MDTRDTLKSMLNNVINDNIDGASLDLHNYLAVKMREVSGIGNPPAAQSDTDAE